MKRLLILVTLLVACGKDGTGPDVPDISGNWHLVETATIAALSMNCSSDGTATINQIGGGFSGSYVQTGSCTYGGQLYDNSGSGALVDGTIDGDQVTFREEDCVYIGKAAGSPVNRLEGTVVCPWENSGQTYQFNGTWTATR